VVIDTKKLDRKPKIFHTEAISQAVPYWSNGATAIYDYKYVAHGPLKGHGYHTMAVESAYQRAWYDPMCRSTFPCQIIDIAWVMTYVAHMITDPNGQQAIMILRALTYRDLGLDMVHAMRKPSRLVTARP
jgi:hypothetical protein